MKVLLWILPYLVVVIIEAVAMSNGLILGAIPTVLLFVGAGFLSRSLGKKWDERKK